MEIKPFIFYKTTADFNNTGEVLIYRTLLENLRKYGNVIIDDSPRTQPLFLRRIGIKSEERLSFYTKSSFINHIIIQSICNLFRNNTIWFVTGVGDHTVSGWSGAIKNIFAFFFLAFLRLCHVKVLRIGMSIKIDGGLAAISERLLSLLIDNYYVRDGLSLANCLNAGVRANLAPDLSWGYSVEGHKFANSESKTLIVSFRDYIRRNDLESYKNKLFRSIGYIIKKHCENPTNEVLLTYQCDYDQKIAKELYGMYKDYGNVLLASELITLDNAERYYGSASIILSNRLHVLLLGYKYGALTVGLTDLKQHTKIKGIFEDNQIDSVLLDINSTEENLLYDFSRIYQKRFEYWDAIRNVETTNKRVLEHLFQMLFDKYSFMHALEKAY